MESSRGEVTRGTLIQYGGFLSEEGRVDQGPTIEESQSREEEAGMTVIQPQAEEQWDETTEAERAQKCPPLGLGGSVALPSLDFRTEREYTSVILNSPVCALRS